ncbi:MAG: TRAM domain-containing protein [Chloroflexi bacterium]|nr:MAG: TRAM domain-containing protein [Chloroflexota bacterium]
MGLSVEFLFRIIGAIALAISGGMLGDDLARLLGGQIDIYVVVLSLLGFLTGLVLTPYFTTRPIRRARKSLATMPPERLVAIIVGIFLGLVAAALLSLPLSLLPSPFRQILPLAAAIVFCYMSVIILVSRQNDLQAFINSLRPTGQQGEADISENYILLDTSVIIDGRIADISKTGFIRGILLIPNFVLMELQHIADSPDPLRRNRGRRGLEVLSILQNEAPIPTRITDMDVSEVRDVDSKLVALARHLHCPIMTNDYNLNRVAELQGVTVLNINDLANAVKAVYLPGEELTVKIIQEGRETDQGVGYLEDGTMVVVEDGKQYINQTLTVTVTKVLQTTAGRMIFARLQ